MRKIERIFVHCTAGSQRQSIEDLKAEFRLKGWKYPGYHYVVDINGGIHQLLAIELVSNGVQGYNSSAINVAYMGGIDSHGKPIKRMLSFCCFIDLSNNSRMQRSWGTETSGGAIKKNGRSIVLVLMLCLSIRI